MKISSVVHSDHVSTWFILGAALSLFAVYQIVHRVYLAFFGPLSKYPGPRLAKVTRLLNTWHRLHGNAEEWVVSLHEQYGDVVQTTPTHISFATGNAWKDIYGHSVGGKTQQFPKCNKFYTNRPGKDIIYSNDADHTRMRRNLAHAFSDRALREQEPLLRKYVDQLIVRLGEQDGKPIDMVKWYNYTTFDIMGDLTFGEPLGNLNEGQYHPWVSLIFQSIKVGSFFNEMNYFNSLKGVMKAMVPRTMVAKRKQHWELSSGMVDKRLAKEDARPDIWGIVLNAKDSQKLSLAEMHTNSQVLMVAGTETTATLLSGLTYLLLRNPEKMEKVKKEVREKFSSSEEIDIDAVLKLKYLNACFEEALRCYPPVPSGLPRMIPKGGDMVCGEFIPEGTRVAVHQLSTYRNPHNFRRPMEFIPERWLGDAEFANDQRFALQPFSVGPRNCIGKNLAYLEMRLIFSNVIWHYDMKLCDEAKYWSDQKQYILWEKHPLTVHLEPVVREKVSA